MSTGRTCKAALKFPMVRDRGPPLAPDGLIYALRAAADLLNGINLIWPVQSCLRKYFASPVGQIISTNSRHPTPPGAYRDRHGRGVRMRWTRQRFAREGIAGRVERLLSDHRHADERCRRGRQNRVVLTPRRWRQVLRSCVGPTGLRQNDIREMTVAKSPVTGESAT